MVEYDAIIVGAGILGLSTAYHIKAMRPNAKILVIDKLSSSGQANTARSAAAFRCVFSSPTNYRLADPSVEFYRHLQEDLDVDLKMQWLGYLWLLTEENYKEMLPILKNLRREMDLKYEEFEEKYLTQKLRVKTDLTKDEEAQLIGLGNVFGGVLVPKAGVINDLDSLVKFYEKEFLRLDGKIEYSVKVENLSWNHLSLWAFLENPIFGRTREFPASEQTKAYSSRKKLFWQLEFGFPKFWIVLELNVS